MRYELYVGENCHDCKKVHKTIVELGLDIPVKNLDAGAKPPMDLYILPALLTENGELKAYGIDIVRYLKRPESQAPRLKWWKRIF